MSTEYSAKRNVVEAFTLAWKTVRNGDYYVKRGALHWPTWNFDQRPRAVAILVDESTFLRGQNEMTISFEVGIKLRSGDPDEQGIDDGALDDIVDDMQRVFNEVMGKKDARGDDLTYSMGTKEALAIEWQDTNWMAQGVVFIIPEIRY